MNIIDKSNICEIKKKMKDEFKVFLSSIKRTREFAELFSQEVKSRIFISLIGNLGVGKTTFVRFLINAISEKKIKVLSPTFPIVQVYDLPEIVIWHYDLYRLKDKSEIFSLDFDQALNNVVIVEWPEIIKDLLPKQRIEIHFLEDKDEKLSLNIKTFGNLLLKGNYKSYE